MIRRAIVEKPPELAKSMQERQKSWLNILFLSLHHKFPSDFRNGLRWHQWDPTKWFIALLGFAGLARHLVRTPKSVIEKTRLRILATAEARRHHTEAAILTTGRTPMAGAPRGGMYAAQ